MLVLSRRPNERIVLPNSNTKIQVVAIKAGVVRLGIEAPANVPVLREELWDGQMASVEAASESAADPKLLRELNHMVRNHANTAGVGLALLRRQLQAGLVPATEATLAKIDHEIRQLQQNVENSIRPLTPSGPKIGRRALLVEDNQNERELLAGFLRLAGLDVDTAGDGGDALDYLRDQSRPDVVLLDMGLPRVDGASCVRQIRSQPALAGIKIFAVSGHGPDQFDFEKGSRGVDRWFRKPLDPETFLKDLRCELAGVV